ncbi:hypothetical protein KY285_001166 [Solanum tuberosum]|nr:hypothetical protein KY285_001166 [Solanum tuberosum]
MPPRTAFRGRPARRNVEPQKQEVPNAPEVQPQGEVTNAEFWEAMRMLSQDVTNQVGHRENRQEVTNTLRIRGSLRMNPPSFTSSSVTEDLKKFVEELQKVFEIMHISDVERVELEAYQMKGVARIWFDQWEKNRAEGAPLVSWALFEEAFLGHFFPRELREAKVQEFLTLKEESMSVNEYSLKFTQLFRYASEMVADMRSKMSLFVAGLSHLSNREKFRNKRAKTENESEQQKSNANRSYFQQKQKGPVPSSSSAPAPSNKGSVAQGGSKTPACAKCGRSHSGVCRDGSTDFFKFGQNGHFMKECPKNRQGNGNGAIYPNLLHLLHQTWLHLEELLLKGQTEEQTVFMLLLVARSKRTRKMLSLVWTGFMPVMPQLIVELELLSSSFLISQL